MKYWNTLTSPSSCNTKCTATKLKKICKTKFFLKWKKNILDQLLKYLGQNATFNNLYINTYKLDGGAPLVPDPPRWNSTNKQNPPIQKNCCDSWTNFAVFVVVANLTYSVFFWAAFSKIIT